jgi:hypothetical protein
VGVDREEIIAAITRRASSDEDFCAALRSDPRAAVGDELGVTIPETVRITVLEDSLTHVHLVLPAAEGAELTDADLALVAGGTSWYDKAHYDTSDDPFLGS